ncbi:hypothetical protein Val02_05350 [Virgisporangium aliadipatigenens]|uniref:HIT domain-containing protein n=1 Tax=Virgisporangium aliadipatigenens TaxID=741659 RepID=A0A8J3YEG6_9ACTN|nr:GrpB family protein [Virgisporangium aliadipatigenens]GIJ43649.1 hypothetical protein Val02_05350 [Virgisporangium aliadipatigenens]
MPDVRAGDFVGAMTAAGWTHAPEPGDEPARKWSFCYPDVGRRTHHLHVVEDAAANWRSLLAFRDHLRGHPGDAAEYARLKRRLAAVDPDDRPRYRAGKAPFIEELLRRIATARHEPAGYVCPMCRQLALPDNDDIVRRAALATAFVSPRWWPNNHGHVIVVPNDHHENLYELPTRYGHAVHDLVREIAIALRHTYGCAGTSVRQHNEPAGNQDVWHHHVHVFPRYAGDDLYGSRPRPELVSAERRRPYAERRAYFTSDAFLSGHA